MFNDDGALNNNDTFANDNGTYNDDDALNEDNLPNSYIHVSIMSNVKKVHRCPIYTGLCSRYFLYRISVESVHTNNQPSDGKDRQRQNEAV